MNLRKTTTVGILVRDRYLRSLVSAALFLEPDLRVIVRAPDLDEALPDLARGVDVVVWDASGDISGLAHDAVRLKGVCRGVGLLGLIGEVSPSELHQMGRLGFRGFVRRDAPLANVVRAVRQLGSALTAEGALRELQVTAS